MVHEGFSAKMTDVIMQRPSKVLCYDKDGGLSHFFVSALLLMEVHNFSRNAACCQVADRCTKAEVAKGSWAAKVAMISAKHGQ